MADSESRVAIRWAKRIPAAMMRACALVNGMSSCIVGVSDKEHSVAWMGSKNSGGKIKPP
jgi:hypothetical protein